MVSYLIDRQSALLVCCAAVFGGTLAKGQDMSFPTPRAHVADEQSSDAELQPNQIQNRIPAYFDEETESIVLIACHDCGHPAKACACVASADESYLTAGSAAGVDSGAASACRFTNLFWCNPYGEVYLDRCDDRHCPDCDQSSALLWYAAADLVPLMRDQPDDLAFQRLGQAGEVVLDTGTFETELDAGARLTGGIVLTDLFRLDGTYLGAHEWSDRAAVRNLDGNSAGGTGNLFGPFSNFGTPVPQAGTDFNNFASIDMSSKFNSIELNLRRRLIIPVDPDIEVRGACVASSILVGFRRVNLDEQFGYITQSTIPAGGTLNRARISTDNELLGVQVGLLSQILIRNGQGWIDLEIKGGVYENEVSLRSALDTSDLAGTPINQFTGTDQRDRTAFLGELSLVYNRQVSRNLSCRLGYNALVLSGVALASDNLNTDYSLLSLGPALVDHDQDLVLHGPTMGLTWAY